MSAVIWAKTMKIRQLSVSMLERPHSPNTASTSDTANLAMVTQHLNVSVGPIDHVCDLVLALRSGVFGVCLARRRSRPWSTYSGKSVQA